MLINETSIYSEDAFNKLLANAEIQAALQKQYGTHNIQVFENFLDLPLENQADAYKAKLLDRLSTWSEKKLIIKRTEVEREQLEQAEEQAEIARLSSLVNVPNEDKYPAAQTINEQAATSTEHQHKQLIPILSRGKILTTGSALLFLGGGVATGLFFLGLPLWAVITAGIGTFVLSSLLAASYAYIKQNYADTSDKPYSVLDQTPVIYPDHLPTVPVTVINPEPTVTNNQPPIPTLDHLAANNQIFA